MDDDEIVKRLWDMAPMFVGGAPHSRILGINFVSVARGRATLSLPYSKIIIGDPRTRIIHGGAITNCSGTLL